MNKSPPLELARQMYKYNNTSADLIMIFLINIHVNNHSDTKLEWGCPNGTKYPPRQPIQTIQVMHQIGEAVMRQKPFSVILAL